MESSPFRHTRFAESLSVTNDRSFDRSLARLQQSFPPRFPSSLSTFAAFVLIKVVEEFHYDTKHVREGLDVQPHSPPRYRSPRSISRSRRSRLRQLLQPLPFPLCHLFFSSPLYTPSVSRVHSRCKPLEEIFIGTRARSYVGNVNHKRRLREILIDSRGQLNRFFFFFTRSRRNRG